jgi:hypothetical protein
MQSPTHKSTEGLSGSGRTGLFPVEIGRQDHGQLKLDAADLLVGCGGVDTGTECHDTKGGLAALDLGGGDGNVEVDILKGNGLATGGLAKVEAVWASVAANGGWAQAGDFFGSVFCAVMNLCESGGNKFSEVHG